MRGRVYGYVGNETGEALVGAQGVVAFVRAKTQLPHVMREMPRLPGAAWANRLATEGGRLRAM